MQTDKATRVHRAVTAAEAVAARYGLPARRTRVLHDANNVVVHLAPSPVVAKVCPAASGGWDKLEREVEVARHLIRAGAPVVGPSRELPAGPHAADGFAITFWRHHSHEAGALLSGRFCAETLAAVHSALAGYPAPLPSFLDRRVKRTGDTLCEPSHPTALLAPDRAFLQREYISITSRLETCRLENQPLHGDPHAGNFLVGRNGCLMIDFESVCAGPVEWDVSALPGGGAGVFAVDEELLAVLLRLRSICVAVWCAGRAARSNEMARAASLHLGLLREAA